MKKTVIILGAVIIVLLGILVFYNPAQQPSVTPYPTSTAGGGIGPQPIVSADGHVAVTAPLANDAISSPVTVMGSVTGGGWFFEASFPVKVLDSTGKVIGTGTAQAQPPGAWMSTGTVPFAAKITFTAPTTAAGTILLQKDNPSGDPKNAAELRIPVRFSGSVGTGGSGVNGTVVLLPTCPVQTNPPTPGCLPKPYQTTIAVSRAESASPAPMRTISSDAQGNFSVDLAPGSYAFMAQGGNPLPRCSPSSVTVTAGTYQTIELRCDTGIR